MQATVVLNINVLARSRIGMFVDVAGLVGIKGNIPVSCFDNIALKNHLWKLRDATLGPRVPHGWVHVLYR